MPVDNSGSCNTYSNARWLSDDEIALLERWAATDALPGDSEKELPLPPPPAMLDDPDVLLDVGVSYTPDDSSGHDDYRCFIVPSPVTKAASLTKYQVLPGDPRVVHHVIVYQPADDAELEAARELDEQHTGPGYTCFGGPAIEAEPFVLWAPGGGAVDLPAGTGIPLAAGRDLVVQVHYNLENGVYPDRTKVGLVFADKPVIPAAYLPVANLGMRLTPGMERVEASETIELGVNAYFKVHGALPHMHTLGRTLRVEARSGDESTCLVDVDRWNFHWQNAWWYEQPLDLQQVDAVSISCGFDTRGRSEVVTWGESTSDEMCLSYFYVTTQDQPDAEVSCNNGENPMFDSCLDQLLTGCFAPDLDGTCTTADGTVSWSDGSKVVSLAMMPGIYAPDSEEPCIEIGIAESGVVLSKGSESLSYSLGTKPVRFECPDGSTFTATGAQVREFQICRGLACPVE
jgi:hypothetical protein